MIGKQNFIKLFQKCMMCKRLLKCMMYINYHNQCIRSHLIYIVLLGMIIQTGFQITRMEKYKNCISPLRSSSMMCNLQSIKNMYLVLYQPSKQFRIDQPVYIFQIINKILDRILYIGYLECKARKYQGIINIFQIVNICRQRILVRMWFILIDILRRNHYIH